MIHTPPLPPPLPSLKGEVGRGGMDNVFKTRRIIRKVSMHTLAAWLYSLKASALLAMFSASDLP